MSHPRPSKHLVCLILCLYTFSVRCQIDHTAAVEEGRQLIQDMYRNYTDLSPSSKPVDLILVLDRSASVTVSGWLSVLRFVKNFLEHFTIDADNTRVAVISYGTTASLDIDGISSGQYNKCSFVARLQMQMAKKVPSGYSATHDALVRAKDVALTARPNAKKAVIIITDGKSNTGPPPVRASVELRSLTWDQSWNVTSDGPQLQVYTFGVKDAYMPEVRSIASQQPNHTFYIPTFVGFAELARSLHDDSQSESWQALSDSSSCRGLCHEKAYCACATRSGQYLCICRDGYQGDGITCTACPKGTFKSRISPSRCVLCPANSTTLVEGAADVKQCVCQPPLYQNASGYPCQLRYCQDLPDIEHGHKFHVAGRVVDELPDTGRPCQNLPDSSCHFSCDVGYRLGGHPGLMCLSNGSWEGDVPSCHIMDCGLLSYHHQEPVHATVEYVNQTTTYGSVVRVRCDRGWRTFGDRERVCTHYGAWSGTQTWCVENRCPALTLSPGLIIMPANCGRAAQVPGSMCQYMCELGYELIGPPHVECTDHGTWDTITAAECVDRQPPSITCPADITTPVTTANFAVIHWKSYPPSVTDNSGEFIITIIGVAESGDSLRLTAGYHHIKYVARDKAGNEAFCLQGITILDFTVHLVTCPEADVTINMTSHQQEADWPEVVFADHNNMTVAHKCVPANNTLLPAGTYTVICVPDTQSYQQTHCTFRAIFRQPRCDIPPPPLHGSLSCSPTPTSLMTCIPHCQEDFDFFHLPQRAYVCDLDGNWGRRVAGYFWPDCSRKYLIRRALLFGQASYYYYGGQCKNNKDEISNKFTALLHSQARDLCGMNMCSIERVNVFCGNDSKRKRSTTGQRVFSHKTPANVLRKHQVNISSSLIKLLLEKITEATSTETSLEKSSDPYQKHQINTSTSSLTNVPLERRKETYSTVVTPNIASEASAFSFKDMVGFVKKRHYIKRSVSNHSVLGDTNNLEKDQTKVRGQQGNETHGLELLYQTVTKINNKYSDNKDKENSRQTNEMEGVITRNLYQTVLQNQDLANSRSFDRMEETTRCSNCLEENIKYSIPQDTESFPFFPESTVTAPQMSEKLLDPNVRSREMVVPSGQDMPQSDSSNIIFAKRSVEGITSVFDSPGVDYDHPFDLSGSSLSPPVDYFLDNVTPRSYQDEDEVLIEFVITKEILNTTVNEFEQADMLQVLLDVFMWLNSSLESQNLILDGYNATGADNESNILYANSHVIDEPVLDACDFGYVSRSGVTMSAQICVACPPGSKYNQTSAQCLVCPADSYQPEEGQLVCLNCPYNTMTEFQGANNISLCLAMCNPGQYSGTGLSPCEPCPLHSYQPMSSATTCLPCTMGRKTLITGAVHAIECLDLCDPGMYSKTGLVPCMPCPVGSYQPNRGSNDCLLCGDGLTTTTNQASNASECFAWDACSSTDLRCAENGSMCVVENNVATCVCASGFSGTSCEINIPDCFVSSCQNNGTCVDGINTFACDCLPGFTGTKCEGNIDECLSSPCQHGSSCLDLFNGYQCFCLYDYTGAHCETKMSLCDGSACVNGQCDETNGTTTCICNQGFAGSTCNMTIDLCSSHPCNNAGRCISTSGHFQCDCLQGFIGTLCENVLDPCEDSNCSMMSVCIPAQSGQFVYLCKCFSGWSGEFCQYEATADFDLVFNADGPDGQYVVLPPEFMPSLVNFTVCTWLRPQLLSAFATIVAFTLPQLLTFGDSDYYLGREIEEIFSIKHTDKLIVNIFNHSISTNVSLTFLVWSHLCVTWSCTSNHWQVVVNGSLSAEGTVHHLQSSLPPHVQVVIGQNNPFYAEASMLWDVYAGEISQFNIFSQVLTLDTLRGLASGRTCNTTFGDIISWSDVTMYTKGDLVISEISHCLDVNECWFPLEFPCGNNRECEDLIGSYNCSSCMYGYTGRNCEQPEDECDRDKCIRGECVDGPDPYDFQCICPPGYTGYLCDVMIDLCLSSPCQNGGVCISGLNTFTCTCPMEHMGPHCEIPGSVCSPSPCQNHGVCVEMSADTFECSCSESFTGTFCERRRHWCEENVCHNEGECQNQSLSLQNVISQSHDESFCKCKNGWMGRQCEVRMVLSCDLYPCANGGSCFPMSESQQGYRCQCLEMPNLKVDENCEYLNPCDLSPCPNNTLCVQLSNSFLCLCVDGRSCESHDTPTLNTSDHEQIISPTEKTTLTSHGNLSSAGIWALSVVSAILFLLVAPFICCILWRRKCTRSDEQILRMSDVDRDHFTNPAFHSEELQLEENIYTEPGDDYPLQNGDGTGEDFGSQQGNIRSTSLHEASSGCYISSSSGSFSSLPSSKKPREEDDMVKPLLSNDYLEPAAFGMATSQDSKHVEAVSMDMLPRLRISNEGFDPVDDIISDNRSRQNVGSNLTGVDGTCESDRTCYVNGNVLHNESAHCTNLSENVNEDIRPVAISKSSGINKPPEHHGRQVPLSIATYINIRPVGHKSEKEDLNSLPFISFSHGDLEIVQNPDYISLGNKPAEVLKDTTSQYEAGSLHGDACINQVSKSDAESLPDFQIQQEFLENAGTAVKSFADMYVPFTDVWHAGNDAHSVLPKSKSTGQSDHSTVAAKRENSDIRKVVSRSFQTPANFLPNECSSCQQLTVLDQTSRAHKPQIQPAHHPVAPSAASNTVYSGTSEYHHPRNEAKPVTAEMKPALVKISLSEDSLESTFSVAPSNRESLTLSQQTNLSSYYTPPVSLPLPSLPSLSGQKGSSSPAHLAPKFEDKGKIQSVPEDSSPKVSSA